MIREREREGESLPFVLFLKLNFSFPLLVKETKGCDWERTEMKLSNYDLLSSSSSKIHFYLLTHVRQESSNSPFHQSGSERRRRKKKTRKRESYPSFRHANPLDANFHTTSNHHHLLPLTSSLSLSPCFGTQKLEFCPSFLHPLCPV